MDALTIAKMPWSESEELRFLFSYLSLSPEPHNTYVRTLDAKMRSSEVSFFGPD